LDKDVYWQWDQDLKKKDNFLLKWKASPFVSFDDEFKVYLLFRLTNLSSEPDVDLTGEYYRFAAEFEPVQRHTVSVETIKPWLPKEPSSEQDLGVSDEIRELRTKAENAFSNGSFEEAIDYYEKLAHQDNTRIYNHVAKSRHGAALWRVANKKDSSEEKKTLFQKAIELLKQASEHIDFGYQAEARYQKSKALWHLAKIDDKHKEDYIKQALAEAEKAKSLALLERYTSWYEWLQERTDNRETETDNPESETDNSEEEVSESNNS
jgi:tetratricopeptide (TPR) repeat protein